MMRDARRLASPNAGYPEAAMAGALDRALAGPRQYAGGVTEGDWLNQAASADATAADIRRSVRITWAAWGLLFALVLVIAILLF